MHYGCSLQTGPFFFTKLYNSLTSAGPFRDATVPRGTNSLRAAVRSTLDRVLFSTCYTRISLREGDQRPLTDSKARAFHSLPEFFTLSSRGHHVQQNWHAFVSRILWVLAPITLLALGAATTAAQHTEVRNNGVGGKIELDYNAAGKVTEMRTIGADGKLQQKVDYEYLPGYYGAQQTDTTYWPSGKVRRVARNTYDQSSNFTGEFIQVLDESGKQIAGHKLTHDPWTGIYRCNEWNVAAQNYKPIQCPAGEESEGGAEAVKKFTYDEVMQHLEAARQTARQQQKIEHMQPMTPVQPSITTANKEVGLVLPAQVRTGERVSGRVVQNLEQYDGMPEVTVTRLALPFESVGEASRLWGWFFEAPGESQQRADGPITLVVPRGASGLSVTFRQAGNPAHSVSKMLNFPQSSAKKQQPPDSFKAAALCLKGGLCAVSGPFSGDSSKTFAASEDRPATIVAETSDMAYVSIPELTEPGSRPLFVAEGTKGIAAPVVVGDFFVKNNGRELQPGQTLIVFPTLDGPGDIPDPEWRTGNFPPANLEQARHLVPGFQLPKQDREARKKRGAKGKGESKGKRESDEKKGGEILLVVKNVTPEQISLRSSKNDMLVFHLSDDSFSRGEFKYDLVVEAKKPGAVNVKGYVIPFLAPIAGQEFTVKPIATGK